MNTNQDFKMPFSLGTNFDPAIVEEIAKKDKHKQIKSLFGKFKTDIVGGGRASIILPKLTVKDLERYIDQCHRNDIKFNYLLNPACLDNRDLVPREHKKILRFIDKLANAGVDALTINSPYFCELIKNHFPDMGITIGLYAGVSTLKRIKQWEELGADEITLLTDATRDFPLLEHYLNYTKNTGTQLRIIANNVCLHHCPYELYHGSVQAHASQKGHSSSKFYLDYSLLNCNNKKIKNPVKLITSGWIRPEDINLYEDLCHKTGNYNFSIKLLERSKTTEFLHRVINAYLSRSYEGNFMKLLTWPEKQDSQRIFNFSTYYNSFKKGFNGKELAKLGDVFRLPEIYIDNKKLDGFAKKFVNGYVCDKMLCDDENGSTKNGKNGELCSYCRTWADKAITYNQQELDEWLKVSDDFLEGLNNSKTYSMFGTKNFNSQKNAANARKLNQVSE